MPLVTFALFAYNQEEYIREAVQGALGQTYEPLEILLSDDCSSDQTFSVMSELAASYKGPHHITLNRNAQNLGISRHVRYLHKIAKGTFIVHAAGDDISLPYRTTALVEAFLSQERCPSLVMSNSELIRADGEVVGIYGRTQEPVREQELFPLYAISAGGAATFAITRDLVTRFPDPDDRLFAEDRLLLLRARMLDGVFYIPQVLVKYRITETGAWSSTLDPGLSSAEIVRRRLCRSLDYIKIYEQIIEDIKFAGISLDDRSRKRLETEMQSTNNWVKISGANFLVSALSTLSELRLSGFQRDVMAFFVFRWFPVLRIFRDSIRRAFDFVLQRSSKPLA